MSRKRYLGLYSDNDPEKPDQKYGKSILDMDENMENSIDSDENSKFEIDRRQYLLDKEDLDNTHVVTTITNPLPHTCNLDPDN